MLDDKIMLPCAPAIEGLIFRRFRGDGDAALMRQVMLASERPDEVVEEDFPDGLAKTDRFDPQQDVILVEVRGEVVGGGRIGAVYEREQRREYHLSGYLLPEWRREKIGSAILAWLENRVREKEFEPSSRQGTLDGKRVFTHVGAKEHQKGLAILLERAGYQQNHTYLVMTRSLLEVIPEPVLPEGIEVKPVLPEHYRAVWAAMCEGFAEEYPDWTPTEEDFEQWTRGPLFQPDLWQIAWDVAGNFVAGHVLTYIPYEENRMANRKRGFSEDIAVVRSWRKRGLASALIALSLRTLKAAGMTESALVVDGDNRSGAQKLYERCGFQVIERNATYQKEIA